MQRHAVGENDKNTGCCAGSAGTSYGATHNECRRVRSSGTDDRSDLKETKGGQKQPFGIELCVELAEE